MTDYKLISPRWNTMTKLVVVLVAIVLLGWVVVQFQSLIPPLLMAVILAYLLNPLITTLVERFRWNRTFAAVLVYLVLLLIVAGLATGLVIYILNQLAVLSDIFQAIITTLPERIDDLTHSQVAVFGIEIDLRQFEVATLYAQINEALRPVLVQAGTSVQEAIGSTAAFFGWALFVLVISFYIAKDMPGLGPVISRMAADPGYDQDVTRLMEELAEIWNDFLRGQALLAIVIGVVSWVGLTVLGVRYALALALLSGLLEMVPTIGPIVSGVVAVAVALFQDSNWLGLNPIVYALVVLAFFIVVQQIENNFLVPRIIGDTLDLHPVLIMCGAIMGGTLAGIIGILLAAPMMATVRLLARYAWRKLLDQPPFPEEMPSREKKPMFGLATSGVITFFKRRASPSSPDTPPKQPLDGEQEAKP